MASVNALPAPILSTGAARISPTAQMELSGMAMNAHLLLALLALTGMKLSVSTTLHACVQLAHSGMAMLALPSPTNVHQEQVGTAIAVLLIAPSVLQDISGMATNARLSNVDAPKAWNTSTVNASPQAASALREPTTMESHAFPLPLAREAEFGTVS